MIQPPVENLENSVFEQFATDEYNCGTCKRKSYRVPVNSIRKKPTNMAMASHSNDIDQSLETGLALHYTAVLLIKPLSRDPI